MFCDEKGQDRAFGADALSRWAASFFLVPKKVELKESGQNILSARIFRPAVGGEDGVVQFPVGVLQPGGTYNAADFAGAAERFTILVLRPGELLKKVRL